MAVWRRAAVVLSLLGPLMTVGCQQAAEQPVVRPLAQPVPPLADSGVAEGVMSGFVTAMPWPTFTPVPAPRADLLPVVAPIVAATPLPTVAVSAPPTATPFPTPVATTTPAVLPTVDVSSLSPARFLATPTPLPFQLSITGTDVRVARQTVFMSQYLEGPDFWPTPAAVFYARTARFIGWRVLLDFTDAPDDFTMTGLMRWLNISNGEHVIHQEPYTIEPGRDLIFMMGQPVPGFWAPGRYRVELWDNRDRVAVYYDFEVRSGVTR